jgi:hypothetical protein
MQASSSLSSKLAGAGYIADVKGIWTMECEKSLMEEQSHSSLPLHFRGAFVFELSYS